ncbi:hypothetical protein NZL82_14910 [Sphingomonas sanguinis]|uniref:hypothetical protein n=1 Tax=Sphingomonas TaxID=13687 RepID=UPI0021BB2EF0|nr:hypothetical protein [Sphingomonas sp. LC-1]MCT8003167.1 hypothetical protein [Sphingomonas sp. LC-1]
MPRLSFGDLIPVYRATVFDGPGRDGHVVVGDAVMAQLLLRIDGDPEEGAETGLVLRSERNEVAPGADVLVRIDAPRVGLGLFARTTDDLLKGPRVCIAEPQAYYVKDVDFARGDAPVPDLIVRYRTMLKLVTLFGEAASYFDETRAELVFVKDGKFVVPVTYGVHELTMMAIDNANALLDLFDRDEHREQKLEILGGALMDIAHAHPHKLRFSYLVANLNAVLKAVQDGYRLFASSFSYAKIRSQLEDARIDFATKIHKTIVDIQAQLLGLPVASVIVASQLKVAKACSLDLWTDVAVLAGAWIFVGLLMFGVINQWLTLSVLSTEISRQKAKLKSDYAAISEQFDDVFKSLGWRVCWHRIVLAIIALVAVIGALFATFAFYNVVQTDVAACLTGRSAIGNAM